MVRVKVCGITNLHDAQAAVDCGADAVGFIFAPSPRQVTPSVVKDIAYQLPPFICKVGVFANSGLSEVQKTMSECNLDVAQLHGDEDPDYCAAFFPKAIKVFTVHTIPRGEKLARYKVAAFMLDKEKTASPAGDEQTKLWKLARKIADYGPVVLAGGLDPENVRRAISIARPYAVDVSSGVESRPGKKDHEKLRAFITTAKNENTGPEQ